MKGSVTVENITLTNSIGFWNSVRISGGTAIFNNVTIHSVKGGGIEANGGTVTPVSYTHLDVYKRQVIDAVAFSMIDI